MLIHVTQHDFDRADAELPPEAFGWMRQEFAANFALQRAFPEAQEIRVDRSGIQIDGQRFRRPLAVHQRRKPYVFKLGRSKLLVRFYDLAGLFPAGVFRDGG